MKLWARSVATRLFQLKQGALNTLPCAQELTAFLLTQVHIHVAADWVSSLTHPPKRDQTYLKACRTPFHKEPCRSTQKP